MNLNVYHYYSDTYLYGYNLAHASRSTQGIWYSELLIVRCLPVFGLS